MSLVAYDRKYLRRSLGISMSPKKGFLCVSNLRKLKRIRLDWCDCRGISIERAPFFLGSPAPKVTFSKKKRYYDQQLSCYHLSLALAPIGASSSTHCPVMVDLLHVAYSIGYREGLCSLCSALYVSQGIPGSHSTQGPLSTPHGVKARLRR